MRKRRTFLISFLILAALVFVSIYICDRTIEKAAEGKLYDQTQTIPHNKVGLLLGTSKYLAGGFINPYYNYRVQTAVQLLKAGKINYIIVSGDNSRKNYLLN